MSQPAAAFAERIRFAARVSNEAMRRAYVTLMARGAGYLPGVEALGRSLDRAGCTAPRIAMVTPDVPERARRAAASRGWEVREVAAIPCPAPDSLFPRFRHAFTKLRVFGLEGIDRAVFLDADTLVLANIDALFDRADFAAAPDFLVPDELNSGVMVVSPSAALFERMMAALDHAGSYDGGDQGFLNRFVGDWYTGPPERRLPSGYNTHHFIYQFILAHPTLRRELGPTVRVVHYTVQKPWSDWPLPLISGGAGRGWRVYLESHPERDRPWRHRVRALQDLAFDRLVGLVAR
jgi:hypothetical protein